MALFRFHRGSLEDSLKTTVLVKTKRELMDVIRKQNDPWIVTVESILIEPYPTVDKCFDERIGWYTHIVKVKHGEFKEFVPTGFLSESLDK